MEEETEGETNDINTHTHSSLPPINKQILFYWFFSRSMVILNFKSLNISKRLIVPDLL